ncbi:MAG: hypothetical protein ACXV8O_21295 [Methylobacter sp.]
MCNSARLYVGLCRQSQDWPVAISRNANLFSPAPDKVHGVGL